ncbi:MAG: hypoxanthine phosphoribosyltransferase [Myxococcota bacterium]|jgi:hypoxanthine phosphoribosyltransferase|nr:hypoxanthine phosphoribosyltransferase [Deltaproteobacteria bacterium]MDP7073136.1 hypoxanthine phosphoribosyltransferase [Myxococcota bacterium]MDP7300305.1 hypoxanthine phosphoribosyltransferase [Myxococcota bacterium]MDP7434288.1 hypoxanthine phosphoribosyltransferase [Myxococcota bacterium]HJO24316.1 hypoxanthine phosphoribosyltransferase [Myxococcota bacterium]
MPVSELISAQRIQRRVGELGSLITADYAGVGKLVVIGVLKGAFMFTADLVRSLQVPCSIEFIRATSYGNEMQSSGEVTITHQPDIAGQEVLLVEDLIDTGLTVNTIVEEFWKLGPASLKVCALLDKPSARKYPAEADYFGFEIPDTFVVGYGIDHAERFRELPFIGTVD